jgi:arylsulfatase A-like enzyme
VPPTHRRAFPAGLALGLLAACSDDTPRRAGPPNVLLISIDSLRPDHLGCYGYRSATGAPTSPNLDRLAAGGIVFENAVSTTSWTMPSHHSLFTSLPCLAHGAIDDAFTPTPERVELGAVLSDADYATAGFFSGPYLDARYGFGRGFESWQNASGVEEKIAAGIEEIERTIPPDPTEEDKRNIQRKATELTENLYHRAESADCVSDRAIAWLDERRAQAPAQPFLLFLHYFDVHYDFAPPEEGYARRFWPDGRRPRLNGDDFHLSPEVHPGMSRADLAGVISYYDGEILCTDEQVGRVLDHLGELGIAEETLVVVVTDHGDEFFEHGRKGHRQNLYQSTLAMGLIASWPGRLPAGKRIASRVSIVDVAPTILDLAGALPKADFHAPVSEALARGDLEHGMWGRSLVPLIDGRESADRECTGFVADRWSTTDESTVTWALWTGGMKVLVSKRYRLPPKDPAAVETNGTPERREYKLVARTSEVYDLVADPGETRDLSGSRAPAVVAATARFDAAFGEDGRLQRFRALPAGPPPRFETELLQDVHRSLMAKLGYVVTEWDERPAGTTLDACLPPSPRFSGPR